MQRASSQPLDIALHFKLLSKLELTVNIEALSVDVLHLIVTTDLNHISVSVLARKLIFNYSHQQSFLLTSYVVVALEK